MVKWLQQVASFSLAVLAVLLSVEGQFTIKVLNSPEACIGGEPCAYQPHVGVYNNKGQISVSYIGNVYVNMGQSPSGFEALYLGGCDYSGCGTRISGTIASVPFVNGIASFEKLTVRTAGVGYTLMFYGRDSIGLEFSKAESSTFAVAIGSLYQLSMSTFVGKATGGVTFLPNPVVAVVDRGGNLIDSVDGYSITASLTGPTGNEVLHPENGLTVSFSGGLAQFQNMYIQEAGYPYVISFNATLDVYVPILNSRAFTVGIGPAYALIIDNGTYISDSIVRGGEFFKTTPRLRLVDKGGNLITSDSTSRVTPEIYENPSSGTLTGSAARMKSGVVSFTALSIDKAGRSYSLSFTLATYNTLTNRYTTTEIVYYSEQFNVVLGPSRTLHSRLVAGRAFAGGQPFLLQPVIELLDYGGNIIVTDDSSTMDVSLSTSLSTQRTIRVDTSLAPSNFVKSVTINVDSGTYGVGEVIKIMVHFQYEVWAESYVSPTLLLTAYNASGYQIHAKLMDEYKSRSMVLYFVYTVQAGDYSTGLDYSGTGALTNGVLVDGNNNTVVTTLPTSGISSNKTIIIDTTSPYVTEISCDTPSGEYGAGQLITFNVSFSQPVTVQGHPYITLNSGVSTTKAIANFSHVLDDSTLAFTYLVRSKEYSANLTFGDLIHLPYSDTWIRRKSDFPTTSANLTITQLQDDFKADYNIIIDTSAPKLDKSYGLTTNHSNGLFYPGEEVYVFLKFDKEIVASGIDINLKLKCGTADVPVACYASYHSILSDDKTMSFLLKVASGVNTSRLDIDTGGKALFIPPFPAYIRRKATFPTTGVNASTTELSNSGNTLSSNSHVQLNGYVPIISSVNVAYYHSSLNSSSLYPDDYVMLYVTFTSRVVASCPPVVMINSGYFREAKYDSGNGTKKLYFKYTVEMGDRANALSYRFTPNAFCLESGCPSFSKCTLRANSTSPSLNADIAMPVIIGTPSAGVPIDTFRNISINPKSSTRNTTVVSVVTRHDPGNYGPGTVIYFDVTFTDDVLYTTKFGFSFPKLYLNTHSYANYSGGSDSKVMTFVYIVSPSDFVSELSPTWLSGRTTAIRCLPSELCELRNRNYVYANLTTPYSIIKETNISLDGNIPTIDAIWSDSPTSPYDGVYTVGEEIYIFVRYDKPVLITGLDPRIIMNVTSSGEPRYAKYVKSASTTFVLVFLYTVQAGDYTPNLMFLGNSLDLNNGLCAIYRAGGLPVTVVKYTLPSVSTLGVNGSIIAIDTIQIPQVSKVTSVSPSGTYYTGDSFIVKVIFTKYVISTGAPYLLLNLGNHYGRATYLASSYSAIGGNTSDALPTEATKELYFRYVVQATDFNSDLGYVDHFSLLQGVDIENNPGYIFAASTNPSLLANIDLPLPGTAGSLSSDETLYIDGGTTYQTGIHFISPAGTYDVSVPVYIQLNFSTSVVVKGSPYILMDIGAGNFNRKATYWTGNNTNSLTFVLMLQPGDKTANLDYAYKRSELSSARSSFQLNGGAIYTKSESPSLSAYVSLNPVGAVLSGNSHTNSSFGLFTFYDLGIIQRGPDFVLRFDTSPGDAHRLLTTTQTLFVSFSNEVKLVPTEAQKPDLVGWAVDISGDLAVTGAPYSNVSETTIQTITTSGAIQAPAKEVQIVQTTIELQPAIQSFNTFADVGITVGGYFRMQYGGGGYSRYIPANVEPTGFRAILQYDFKDLGNITVSREAYIFCACENAFKWTITFNDLNRGTAELLSFDTSRLTGGGATVNGPRVIQEPARLSGGFTLKAFGKETDLIPVDAGYDDISVALSQLGLIMDNVQISPNDETLSRSWTITFGAYQHSYEIPLLSSNISRLQGGKVGVWHRELRAGVHGPGGLAGGFIIEWRGFNTTLIPFDATELQLKTILQQLPVIVFVNVDRSLPTPINGYTWAVEFVEVLTPTSRGYLPEPISNVEPMKAHNFLIGTNTSIKIGSRGQTNDVFGAERKGTFGSQAGAVYMFQQNGERYKQVATIRGNDTNEFDQFGYSVALDGDVLIVGAVGADKNGVNEKQSIFCSADKGSFRLFFRGWTSDPINYDASYVDLYNAIVADPSTLTKLHSVNNILIDDWGPTPLCHNNTAVITFYSPVDGNTQLFPTDTGPNLESLTVVDNLLQYKNNVSGVVNIEEVQAGTRKVHGLNADPQQQGSAYIFRASYNCAANASICFKTKWVQEAQLFPRPSIEPSGFGFSVAISGDCSVVGAPSYQKGMVYVYTYSSITTRWSLLQYIQIPELAVGDNLGYSLSVFENTIVIGAPYANDHQGAAFVFKRSSVGTTFAASQTLYPSRTLFPLQNGDLYGISVAVSENSLVVGAADRDTPSIYFGSKVSSENVNTGAAFVFTRIQASYDFAFVESLVPSNVRSFDRFGWDVDIDGDVIIVGSIEKYDGVLLPNKAIMEVKTEGGSSSIPLGGSFKLLWARTNDTGVWHTATTRSIPFDVSAASLKAIMETDLKTEALLVSRSTPDTYGGYIWQITFIGQIVDVPELQVDSYGLTGHHAQLSTRVINPSPPDLRGKSHVFHRSDGHFIEQFFASPYAYQPSDRCGWQVAVSDNYAIVGCPNRDATIPNHNTGAGIVFYLSLLHVEFSSTSYSVTEGNTLQMTIRRTEADAETVDALFYVTTMDRNGGYDYQLLLQNIFGVRNASRIYPNTISDTVGISGKAVARSQYYGSTHNESVWVDGMYDYRGISDYVPINPPRILLSEDSSMTQELIITPDTILENPNEIVTVGINTPGIWPSVLGNLFTKVTIVDNGDGRVENGFQFGKVYDGSAVGSSQIGDKVTINGELGIMFAGTPSCDAPGVPRAGCVIFYRMVNLQWIQTNKFYSPNPCIDCKFGEEVMVTKMTGRNLSLLSVGEPGANKVHLFVSKGKNVGASWSIEKTLSSKLAFLPQHRYGAAGTIGQFGDMVVVGAPGIEAAFVYLRMFSKIKSAFVWEEYALLRSSDYDYDMMVTGIRQHRQEFGKSVAVSKRTIAVGSPYADYNKLGTDLVEQNWDTEGTDIFGYGRGRAYVFYSTPAVQVLTLSADLQLSRGTFKLHYNHGDINETTSLLNFDDLAGTVESAIEALQSIDDVSVSFSQSLVKGVGYQYSWTISFLSEWHDPPLLQPLWNGNGCTSCIKFSANFTTSATALQREQMFMNRTVLMGSLVEQQAIEASDKASGNKFGSSIALDSDQLIVGAIDSPCAPSTTWDFEAGTLIGWVRTGTAFDYQPTFGDNSYLRPIYPTMTSRFGLKSFGETSGMVGRYYIGTYEKRPGNSSNYATPSTTYPQGNIQGDTPVGTLISDSFMIEGDEISFLIGGGCDYYKTFVELLVDGMSVGKVTGRCRETMEKVSFNVKPYISRSAKLRIVDASSSGWGHINVDEIQFSWKMDGARVENSNTKVSSTGLIKTPQSGAVYAFLRHAAGSNDFCRGAGNCVWSQEAKFSASDRRTGMKFGASLAVNDKAGVLLVGAPGAECTGFYKELQTPYPYLSEKGLSIASGLSFPVDPQGMPYFESLPKMAPQASGAAGVWLNLDSLTEAKDPKSAKSCGAVYLFTKDQAVSTSTGHVTVPQQWFTTERVKLQAPDEFANDNFGSSMSLSGKYLSVGASGQDGLVVNGGAIYAFSAAFSAVSFAKKEFYALEGTDSVAIVTINRNSDIFDGEIILEYATSDLTATGVDSVKFAACSRMATTERGPAKCGDYEQTRGQLVIPKGQNSGGFFVKIMNDLCNERFLEFIQITISVPGSNALQGEYVSAKVRIDDDDFILDECS